MARFFLIRRTPLPPTECWERLTAWPRHGDRVPFTRVSFVRGTGREVGDVVLARTVLGPLRFDDPMEITELVAPGPERDGRCRLVKRGRPVRGWAELRVRAVGGGSAAVWTEELTVAGLPGPFDPVLSRAGRLVFGRVLDHLLGA
ncbi:SRPBCC family protein [Kitasatospora brasiliensis]|uniref:SRPBCC family protein n=1 Tax=Kitasatospora brasiliensis TaxID=3058040 RepID=UPI00292F222C|nr:SRPBCC family protein [Kitasatospora sp. K002]